MSGETSTIRAEQAILGAVLADEYDCANGTARPHSPRLLDQLAGWILPRDFRRPYHSAVWSSLVSIRQEGRHATPEAVRADLARSPGLHRETAQDGLLLHKLMARTPVSSRAPLYGGMVVEASLHRQMHTEAVRLDQAAHSDDPDRLATVRDEARRRVAVMRMCWERVPGSVRLQLDRSASWQATQPTAAEVRADAQRLTDQLQAAQAHVAQRRAAGQQVRAADLSIIELLAEMLQRVLAVVDNLANMSIDARRQPDPAGRTVLAPGQGINGKWPHAFIDPAADALTREDQGQPEPTGQPRPVPRFRALLEGRLIGSLIRGQQQIDHLALTADRIADPNARQMYEAAVDIHRTGGVVDELTIEWAIQRAGGDITNASEAVRAGIDEGMAGQAPHLADQIAAAAIGDRAADVAETMRQAAIDPRVPPSRMLARADAELAAMPDPLTKRRHSPDRYRPQPKRQAEPRPRSREPEPYRRRQRRERDREPEFGI